MKTTHRDFEATKRSLRTYSAEDLLETYRKLYRGKEYQGISRMELTALIMKRLRDYAHLYSMLVFEVQK